MNPTVRHLLRVLAWALLSGVAVIAAAAIVGLLFDVAELSHWRPSLPGMALPTAISLLWLASAVTLFVLTGNRAQEIGPSEEALAEKLLARAAAQKK